MSVDQMAATDVTPIVPARKRLQPSVERRFFSVIGEQLQSEIATRWPRYYGDTGRGEPQLTITPRKCGFSAIFAVDLAFPDNGRRERLIVKIRREHKFGSFLRNDLSDRTVALSRDEYGEHVKTYGFFAGNPELSVVRPLDFIDAHCAMVVAFADGEDLSKLVRKRDATVPASIRRCGLWWRAFHQQLHGSQNQAWDAQAFDAQLDLRLQRLQAFGVPLATLTSLREEVQAAAAQVRATTVPHSLVHGDCKLRHVWATPQGIQVLDFGNSKAGVSWQDPAALVVELSLYSLWGRRFDSAPMAEHIRTLLQAYFDGPPPAAFALYVADVLLKKWHRRLRNWGAGAGLTQLRRSLRAVRLDQTFERAYIDRWFTTQVRAWLAVAGGRPPAWLETAVR